jgi:hypothetical protein
VQPLRSPNLKSEALRASSDLAAFRVKVAAQRVRDALRLEARYSPDQLRVPAGSSAGGQWTSAGTAGEQRVAAAGGYSVGHLITQFMTSDWRRCVYHFDFADVVVAGPDSLSCSPRVPSAAVSHGYRLNDNAPRT